MDSAAARLTSCTLVIIACVVGVLHGDDRTPLRTVTELVSVVYVPPRASPPDDPLDMAPVAMAAGADASPAASGLPDAPSWERVARPHRIVHHAKSPNARNARADRLLAVRQEPVPAAAGPPPVPALFVPIRNLGLRLQAQFRPLQPPDEPRAKKHRRAEVSRTGR